MRQKTGMSPWYVRAFTTSGPLAPMVKALLLLRMHNSASPDAMPRKASMSFARTILPSSEMSTQQ